MERHIEKGKGTGGEGREEGKETERKTHRGRE
jgi:hypothetical protein